MTKARDMGSKPLRDKITRGPNKRWIIKVKTPISKTGLRDSWKLAQSVQILQSFADALSMPPINDIEQLEQELLDESGEQVVLKETIQLLQKFLGVRDTSGDSAAISYTNGRKWLECSAIDKIEILNNLCLEMLKTKKFRQFFDANIKELRLEPVGRVNQDEYYLLDNNRIYIHKNNAGTKVWRCVAWDLPTWHELIIELRTKNEKNRQLLRYLQNLIPVIEQEHERKLALVKQVERAEKKRAKLEFELANRRKPSRRLASKPKNGL